MMNVVRYNRRLSVIVRWRPLLSRLTFMVRNVTSLRCIKVGIVSFSRVRRERSDGL